MKAVLRIATKDPYCYIEGECEGEAHEVVEKYGELYRAYHARFGAGLSPKEFDQFIQNQLAGDGNQTDLVEKLSEEQKAHYQINKRAIARINYKINNITNSKG